VVGELLGWFFELAVGTAVEAAPELAVGCLVGLTIEEPSEFWGGVLHERFLGGGPKDLRLNDT